MKTILIGLILLTSIPTFANSIEGMYKFNFLSSDCKISSHEDFVEIPQSYSGLTIYKNHSFTISLSLNKDNDLVFESLYKEDASSKKRSCVFKRLKSINFSLWSTFHRRLP